MPTFCFRCPDCGEQASYAFRPTPSHPILCAQCGNHMLRDWKAEGANINRENIRAAR